MKRQRTDTVTGAVNAFIDAAEVPCPEHIAEMLNGDGLRQWGIITRSKAATLWTENDLELAGEMAIARQEKKVLRLQGSALSRADDARAINEIDKQIDLLVKREERLSRLLQIHPEATVGKARELVKKNTESRAARAAVEEVDDYLATPMH